MKSARPEPMTVQQFSERWIETTCAPPFIARYHQESVRHWLRLYILPYIGHVRIDRVTPARGADLQQLLFRRGLAPRTVEYALTGVASAMWRDAIRLGFAKRHPFRGLPWPKRRGRPDPFTEDETQRIVAYFRSAKAWGGIYYPWVALLFWTGARPSEIAGLTWGDVDLDVGAATIRRGLVSREETPGKTAGAYRTIAISEETVAMLGRVRPRDVDPAEIICRMENGLAIDSRRWSSYRWKRALSDLRIRHRRMYCARHTYISHALSYGAPTLAVAVHCATSIRTIERCYAAFIPPQAGDPLAVARNRQLAAPSDDARRREAECVAGRPDQLSEDPAPDREAGTSPGGESLMNTPNAAANPAAGQPARREDVSSMSNSKAGRRKAVKGGGAGA